MKRDLKRTKETNGLFEPTVAMQADGHQVQLCNQWFSFGIGNSVKMSIVVVEI